MRLVSSIGASVVSGVVFGALTSLINNVPALLGEVGQAHSDDSAATWTAIFFSLILDAGWTWAALAFALGWLAGASDRLASAAAVSAVAGTVGLLAATVAYYVTDWRFGVEFSGGTAAYWLARAVAFGLPLGAIGAIARRPGLVGVIARLTVPVGAAVSLVLSPLRHGVSGESSANAWAEAAVWCAAAAGAVAVILRSLCSRGRLLPGSGVAPSEAPESAADAPTGPSRA